MEKLHGKTDAGVEKKDIKDQNEKRIQQTRGMLFDGPIFASLLLQGLVLKKQRSSQNEKPSECLKVLFQLLF